MRKTREEKAITLIALIITIVVLLILAVVAINAVTGDGIIQHAVNAKEDYERAEEKENSILSYYEKYLEAQGGADIWDGKTTKVPEIKEGNWYIYNSNEFKFFADFVNGDVEKEGLEITENTTVYLMSNLDLGARQENGELTNSGTEWTPIGDNEKKFIGTFEGNNHYIKGMYVNKEEGGFAGVFGNSTKAIKNLTIKDSYVEAIGNCVGGIVGKGNIIENCHNINTSIEINIDGPYAIGGIAGRGAIIQNCTNYGTVNSTGPSSYRIGGIVGYANDDEKIEIINCKNYANIITEGLNIAGIVGEFNTKDAVEFVIDGCINCGDIVGAKGNLGGIVGNLTRSISEEEKNVNLINCYNTGDVSATDNNVEKGVGGIVGSLANLTTMKACYNTGTIRGTNSEAVGNIIGVFEKDEYRNIEYCYYLAGVTDTTTGAMSETDMKTLNFANQLNSATEEKPWVGSDGQYPRLNWE